MRGQLPCELLKHELQSRNHSLAAWPSSISPQDRRSPDPCFTPNPLQIMLRSLGQTSRASRRVCPRPPVPNRPTLRRSLRRSLRARRAAKRRVSRFVSSSLRWWSAAKRSSRSASFPIQIRRVQALARPGRVGFHRAVSASVPENKKNWRMIRISSCSNGFGS